MDITGGTLQDAAVFVDACARDGAVVHTVTLIVNGQHGGTDVIVEGDIEVNDEIGMTQYKRKFEVH